MSNITNLPLTDEESDYLTDVLGIWTEGYEDTQKEIVVDPTIESAEDLLKAYSSATDDINKGKSILARLQHLRDNNG